MVLAQPASTARLPTLLKDGYADIILNAGFGSPRRGDYYVVYGKADWSGYASGLDLSELEP